MSISGGVSGLEKWNSFERCKSKKVIDILLDDLLLQKKNGMLQF
jgi:hypothetical protein